MIRAQILIDESVADQLRSVSAQTGTSMSDIVRRALAIYFEQREPDVNWIGSLKPTKQKSHDVKDIRASVAARRTREFRR